MTTNLLERRERAMDRADATVDAAWPDRQGVDYESKMTAVAHELEEICRQLERSGSPPLESARSYRYLGSVYYDLAPATGPAYLNKSRSAYQKAEALLAGGDAPLERAKLNFGYANTLREIDRDDIQLLTQAKHRYEQARELFAGHAPQFVPQVDKAMATLNTLIDLAPQIKRVDKNIADVTALEQELAAGGDPKDIATRFAELTSRDGGATAMFVELENIMKRMPELPGQSAKREELRSRLNALQMTLLGKDAPMASDDGLLLGLLQDRVRREVAEGRVDEIRAETLLDTIESFGDALRTQDDSIASLMKRNQRIKSKIASGIDRLRYLSHGIERPKPGTRARRLVDLCWSLRRFLAEEVTRSGKSDGESKLAFDLNVRSASVDKRIYEAANDDDRALVIEQEVLRPFALEIREFAARHHPLWANPIWRGARPSVDANAVLYCGSLSVRRTVAQVCGQSGLELLPAPAGENFSDRRWQQLQKACVTIFQLGARNGSHRASVAYELGIARTLGKPTIVLASRDQKIPFDVDIEPIWLSGKVDDRRAIAEAIEEAQVWMMPRPREISLTQTIAHVLARYPIPHSDTYVNQTLNELQRGDDADPIAANAALTALAGFLAGDDAMLIHPVWPICYPEPGTRRLFHVMPFGPKWADAAAAQAEAACISSGVEYVRGDRVETPNIIRSIWQELNRATHILVDLTGFNANVALELGIAHTIGRQTLIVAQGGAEKRLFPMVAKLRIQPYASASDQALPRLVRGFIR